MTTSRSVKGALREPMASVGFALKSGLFVSHQGDFTMSVGMNSASEHGGAVRAVNPVLGVGYDVVLARLARLTGNREWLLTPIVSRPIGYSMPQDRFVQWRFTSENLGQQAQAVVDAVVAHGVPWMTSMADLDAMSAELVDGLSHHVEYKLPVVLQQRGRAGEARACVKAELDRLSDATHLKAQQYRACAEEFFQELHDGHQPG